MRNLGRWLTWRCRHWSAIYVPKKTSLFRYRTQIQKCFFLSHVSLRMDPWFFIIHFTEIPISPLDMAPWLADILGRPQIPGWSPALQQLQDALHDPGDEGWQVRLQRWPMARYTMKVWTHWFPKIEHLHDLKFSWHFKFRQLPLTAWRNSSNIMVLLSYPLHSMVSSTCLGVLHRKEFIRPDHFLHRLLLDRKSWEPVEQVLIETFLLPIQDMKKSRQTLKV